VATDRTAVRYRRRDYRYAVVAGGERPRTAVEWWTLTGTVVPAPGAWRPAVDVYESADRVVVAVELAGVRARDLEVQLFEDALIIEGHRSAPAGLSGGRYHAAEIPRGRLRLMLALPAVVDPRAAESRFEVGQLVLTLPKRGDPRGR
jgi:HSP20 family protein